MTDTCAGVGRARSRGSVLKIAVRLFSVLLALVTIVAVVASLAQPPGEPAEADAAPALTIGGVPVQGAAVLSDSTDRDAAHRAAEAAATKAAAERKAAAEAAAKKAREERERERAARAAARDPKSVGRAMAAERGWTGSQWRCLESLWTKESGWKVRADNPTSSAYGIPQALPGSKMSSAGSDWRTNPVTQIRWGLGYIDDVYGTPCGAWAHSQAVNWY